MQSFRTGCGKHNKLMNAFCRDYKKMTKKNGKLLQAVPDLGVSHEICVVRIRVTEVTGFSDSYVHF